MKITVIVAAATLLAAPAFADGHASGDAAKGEKVFNKCKSCHMIADGDNVILKGGKTGPNLYGILGRTPGSVEDYRYGNSIVALGEAGTLADGWSEAEFVNFVADPRKYLQEKLDDSKAKSKMSFKLRDAEDAANVWAYLVSVGPAPES